MKHRVRRYFNSRVRIKQSQPKPETMKYVRLAVFLCFVAGIFCANLMDREQLGGFGIWNTYFIEKFKYARIHSMELFYHVLKERLPVFLLLLLFSMTNWGKAAGTIFLSWQSFAAGFFITSSVAVYSIKGLLLIGTAVTPQYLIYIPMYISYFYVAAFWKEKIRMAKREAGKNPVREYLVFASMCICIVSVYLAGIFLESYVNPYLLKKILKFF
ncbi:MAG: hypothetical protein HFI76_04145 [Lachnospiraceae bacterium]|nr:hypothetical protein [Lachnospiraceae bacterium]